MLYLCCCAGFTSQLNLFPKSNLSASVNFRCFSWSRTALVHRDWIWKNNLILVSSATPNKYRIWWIHPTICHVFSIPRGLFEYMVVTIIDRSLIEITLWLNQLTSSIYTTSGRTSSTSWPPRDPPTPVRRASSSRPSSSTTSVLTERLPRTSFWNPSPGLESS